MYDDDLTRMWLEAEFLPIVNKVQPLACKDLYKEPFRLYKEVAVSPEAWDLLKFYVNVPQVKALYESIEKWSNDWHLTAEWCKAAAYFTLQVWIHSGKPGKFFWHPGVTKAVLRYDPPLEGLPLYRPEFGRELYLKEVEKVAREAIVNQPLLKLGKARERARFIESIRACRTVTEYCETVEAACKPRAAKERRKLSRHLRWAARVHVKGDKQIDIVREINLAGGEITPAAVSAAIKSILISLQLRS